MEAGNVNKRIIILICSILITTWNMRCQTVFDKDTTYVFYNPETTPFVKRSFRVFTGGSDISYHFDYDSIKNMGIRGLDFFHSNAYLDEPADTTIICPVSFLDSISYIKMEDIIKLSYQELWQTFCLFNDKGRWIGNRKVFIIDQNEATDSTVVLRQFRFSIDLPR